MQARTNGQGTLKNVPYFIEYNAHTSIVCT